MRPSKQMFPIRAGGTRAEGLGTLEQLVPALTSPICSLCTNGNLPLASHCLGDTAPQLRGAHQASVPHSPPHRSLSFLQGCLGSFLSWGRSGNQLEGPPGTWNPSPATSSLPHTEQTSYAPPHPAAPSATGQLQRPIDLAGSPSLPAAAGEREQLSSWLRASHVPAGGRAVLAGTAGRGAVHQF